MDAAEAGGDATATRDAASVAASDAAALETQASADLAAAEALAGR